jgi:hypothetical protein
MRIFQDMDVADWVHFEEPALLSKKRRKEDSLSIG